MTQAIKCSWKVHTIVSDTDISTANSMVWGPNGALMSQSAFFTGDSVHPGSFVCVISLHFISQTFKNHFCTAGQVYLPWQPKTFMRPDHCILDLTTIILVVLKKVIQGLNNKRDTLLLELKKVHRLCIRYIGWISPVNWRSFLGESKRKQKKLLVHKYDFKILPWQQDCFC